MSTRYPAPLFTSPAGGGAPTDLGALAGLVSSAPLGAVIVGDGTDWTITTAGTDGDVLTMTGGIPSWEPPAAPDLGPLAPLLTPPADGSMIAGSGGDWTELPIGADDQYLTVVSGAPAWTTIPAAVAALHPLVPAADRLAYYTGASTAALTTLTPYARTLLDDADAPAARATLGINTASATVDFGDGQPEGDVVVVTVAAPWVTTGSVIMAAVRGQAPDHDPEDVAVEGLTAYAENVVPGVSFDLIAAAPQGTWGRYTVLATAIG